MSKAEHTPGPWQYDGILPRVTRANGGVVAYVEWQPWGEYPAVREETPVAEANGRLIAAAPDLLAACRSLASYVYAITNPAMLPFAYRDAERAIAKAEGREL